MPVYVGDHLADALHLSKERQRAYLLLLIHLWRRGILDDTDVVPARTTGPGLKARSNSRAPLANFLEIRGGHWHHRHGAQERSRIAAKRQSYSNKAQPTARGRWPTSVAATVTAVEACLCSNSATGSATSAPGTMPGDALRVATRVGVRNNLRFFGHDLRDGETLPAQAGSRRAECIKGLWLYLY
jgi:uncharacterized protein YdaU (DUF1376 family)